MTPVSEARSVRGGYRAGMPTTREAYATALELPGVGRVDLVVAVLRGHQGGRVIRQIIVEGTYSDGAELSADHRVRAHTLLPDVD